MDFCIFTIIKNEHNILEEWIQYHLNLGINHIFIFEDIDSVSHLNIVNKFNKEQVSLNSILDIYKDKNNIIAIRKFSGYQVGFMYKILSNIIGTFNFDWCFYIDVDEYLTFENKDDSLDNIFSQFNDYEFVQLQWKNYGANGHILDPHTSVIETYTKQCDYLIDGVAKNSNSKLAINLNLYKQNYKNRDNKKCFIHHQVFNGNWCKTDYTTDKKQYCFDKIYIKHYITRSFEEWCNKIFNRGQFYNSKKIDDFFKLNTDISKDDIEVKKLLYKFDKTRPQTFCIYAIIKDEHLYLDEWIQYHLNLGINHIFLFEDFGSKSHQEICKKYPNVTCQSILNLYDKKSQEKIKYLRSINYFIQKYMLRNVLNSLVKKFNFDWCFHIDIDEYLTFENKDDSLDNIFKQFYGYDTVAIQWENYNANNLVYMPEENTIDKYTEIFDGPKIDKEKHIMQKQAFNLRRYKYNKYIDITHHQTKDGKWCKTDFSKDLKRKVYKKIYIRHYITRSFEDYIYKIYIRGNIGRGIRELDDFFYMNPKMVNKKEELIKLIPNIINKYK